MILLDHILMGAAVGLAVSPDNPIGVGAFLIGSVFPDIDIIKNPPGTIDYLVKHRAITHSILLSPLYSIILGLIYTQFFDDISLIDTWVLIFLGIEGHILIDLLNSFGTEIFSPFSDKRYYYDLIYEYDLIISVTFLIFTLLMLLDGNNNIIYSWLLSAAIMIYLIQRILSKKNFIKRVKVTYPELMSKVKQITVVPAKYWRWKLICDYNNVNYVIRKIDKSLALEERPITILSPDDRIPEIKTYEKYARVVDTAISNNEIKVSNLIYSPSVYTLTIDKNDLGKKKYNISIPNAKFEDY